MNKLFLVLVLFFTSVSAGFCALSTSDINNINLKEKNMYLLDVNSKALIISVDDESMLEIFPMTSLSDDGKLVFIKANKSGVCDTVIKTQKDEYKIRFVSGQKFDDNNNIDLIKIDIPANMSKEVK